MLRITPNGTELEIKVVPRSSKNRIAGIMNGRLKICVTAAPEKGKANVSVSRTLAKLFGIAPGRVQVVAGATQTRKRVLLEGVSETKVKETLDGIA